MLVSNWSILSLRFWILTLLLVSGIGLFIYRYQTNLVENEVKNTASKITEIYGVNVKYDDSPSSFFPPEYLLHPIYAKASRISAWRVKQILPAVEQFLAAYPIEIIKGNLSDLYLVGTLEFEGKSAGGAYIGRSIYISSRWGFLHYFDSWSMLGIMHAELSSILFHQYVFPEEQWENINPPSWRYEGTERDMLGRNDLYVRTEQLFRDGFLERYSQSSLENDFNILVEWAVVRPGELQELSARYERISKKYELMKQFYKSVDARIDISKFSQAKL